MSNLKSHSKESSSTQFPCPAQSSREGSPHYRDRLLPPARLWWLLSPGPGGAAPEEQQLGGAGPRGRGHEEGADGGRPPAHPEHWHWPRAPRDAGGHQWQWPASSPDTGGEGETTDKAQRWGVRISRPEHALQLSPGDPHSGEEKSSEKKRRINQGCQLQSEDRVFTVERYLKKKRKLYICIRYCINCKRYK